MQTDGLLAVYHQAKRIKSDQRLSEATRAVLDDELLKLCAGRWLDDDTSSEVENDYRRLCNEIMRLDAREGTVYLRHRIASRCKHNASERELSGDACARNTGRSSKTPQGAKRRTIVSSVLKSIGMQLPEFTLESVINEIKRWLITGKSCFLLPPCA